jgi:hypothetical protein
MRRESKSEQSYIDWLKSIGCVLYLPLTQDGDLQDRISGASLQYTGIGTQAYWDANEGMYVFVGPAYHVTSYTLANGWSAATFPDNEVSVLTTFRKNTANGNGQFMCVGNNYTPNWQRLYAGRHHQYGKLEQYIVQLCIHFFRRLGGGYTTTELCMQRTDHTLHSSRKDGEATTGM